METTQTHTGKFCDIVMKGGITSGVVYPPVVVRLAEYLNFKNIGGTSAGAIAAAATAAAQYARNNQTNADAFVALAHLPKELGEPVGRQGTRLFSLFQPQPQTKVIYDVLIQIVLGKSFRAKLRALPVALRGFPWAALLGALPGLLLWWLTAGPSGGWQSWSALAFTGVAALVLFRPVKKEASPNLQAAKSTAGAPKTRLSKWLKLLLTVAGVALALWLPVFYSSLLALLLALLGASVAVLYRLYRHALLTLPNNFFGLCSGYAPEAEATTPPLTTWLADLLDRLAGLPAGGDPLTFGHLWGQPSAGTEDEAVIEDGEEAAPLLGARERAINLEMMTTCLTNGRPYRLPFETRIFFYRPDEFEQLFPPRVVRWVAQHTEPALPYLEDKMKARKIVLSEADREKLKDFRRFPAAADLPVIIATRMSLSFPILLGAVPLYAIDYTRQQHVPARLWFSDGGICSNFPVHFFDSALPQHPTFGVNLRALDPDRPEQLVTMPRKNNSGLLPTWLRFDDPQQGEPLFGFFGALLNALQNWSDNAQTHLPGYRDRIVAIHLDEKTEGGLNLDMPPELIRALGERGADAAQELLKRYPGIGLTEEDRTGKNPIQTTWQNHRWLRYRSLLGQLEKLLLELHEVFLNPLPGDQSYKELLELADSNLPSYRWRSTSRQKLAQRTTARLLAIGRRLARAQQENGVSLQAEAPSPAPDLRVRPRL